MPQMPLIPCPACQKPVSTEAPTCPACGHPIKPPPAPAKKTGLWWGIGCLLAVPALLIVIAIVGMLAAIAIPSFVKARDTSMRMSCINNMRMLDAAKEQAVVEHKYETGATIPDQELSPYLRNGLSGLICPAGGKYTVNPVGQAPECSKQGPLSDAPKGRAGP
jgi:hypothetical protein